MNEFIITFRECLEAALIVGIMYAVLDKNGQHSLKRTLWLSVILSVLSSAVLGRVLYALLEESGAHFKEFLEGIFMFVTAGLLMYVIFWMSKNMTSREAISKQTTDAVGTGGRIGLFMLVYFAILREGFETVIFLVASTNLDNSFSYVGFASGLILAVLIGYLLVIQGKKIKLYPFFKYTSLLLVIFAAGMVAHGTHEVHEYMEYKEHAEMGMEPVGLGDDCAELREHIEGTESMEEAEEEEEYAFNLFPMRDGSASDPGGMYVYNKDCDVYVHMLNSKGIIGSFLNGLFGYNTSPIWMEIILWVLSLGFGLVVWRRAYK